MERSSRPRIEWLDTAKACGMFRVFYDFPNVPRVQGPLLPRLVP